MAFLTEEHARGFDLAIDIPARFVIVKMNPELHFISAVIHHIATDGWSAGIIDQELTHFYNCFSTGTNPSLKQLPLRYRDYSVWHRRRVEEGLLDTQIEFWSRHLQGSKALELHSDYVRPSTLSGKAYEIPIKLNAEVVSALHHLATTHRTSLYVVLLAAFRATIFRTTGESDGAIAMVNANRPQAELEGIVGFFVNTHAIRLTVDRTTTFVELIEQTKKVTTAAQDNADIPFDKVVAHLSPERDLSRTALVQLSEQISRQCSLLQITYMASL